MWETILNFIIEQWPFLALLIVAIIATFVIVWHFSKWYYRFEKVEEKVDDLPCEKHNDLYRRFVNTEEKVKELPCSKHDVCFVLSLPLRNMYLDLHTELKNMD